MELEIQGKEDREIQRVKESIREIVSSNQLLSMATVNNEEPHINTAFYALDDNLNLYILTPPDTIHGQNIEENSSVAVDIHDSHQEWEYDKQGLQIFGTAERAEDVSRALELYNDRYPGLEEFASTPDELGELDSEFYVIKPERIKVFDEPQFGTETWIEVEVR